MIDESKYSALARSALKFLDENKEGYELKIIGNRLILTVPVKDSNLPDEIKKFHENERGAKLLDMNDILEQVACFIPKQIYTLSFDDGTTFTGNAAQIAFNYCAYKNISLFIEGEALFANLGENSEKKLIAEFRRRLDTDLLSAYALFFFEYLYSLENNPFDGYTITEA